MSDVAVNVEGLSKFYRIGSRRNGYNTIRESIMGAVSFAFKRKREAYTGAQRARRKQSPGLSAASSADHIWALKEVSFQVQQGEVVGIIGRNGAGKSTLLKILSRITPPTAGNAEIRGRVASLLEVGTGFHPELTGRENILLNGAVLGMRKSEILKQFDAIVDFAEVEEFIDTPLKHYSSGMYLRLAFAVAAHLQPEVLLVDEVLAVGDAAFQKKCMGRIGDVARIGRTVLFVSHNMGAVNQICQRAVWIEKGKVLAEGMANDVVARYLSAVNDCSAQCRAFPPDPDKALQVRKVSLKNDRGEPASRFNIGSRIHLEVDYEVHRMLTGSNVSVALTRNGMDIFCSFDSDANPQILEKRTPGVYRYRLWFPTELLKAGFYSIHIDAGIINRNSIDRHSDVVSFRIEDYGENTAFKAYAEHRPGVLRMPVVWEQT